MKITNVKLGILSVPLHVPFKTALRSVSSVEDVIVEIHTDTGAIGYGEAPPTGAITGDTTGAILGALRDHIIKTIVGREVDDFESLMQAVNNCIVKNSSAKAAVDMALWDLYGQLYQIPVYKLLGGSRSKIITDITISVNSPEEMARDARNAVDRGYDTLKIKVGADPSLDVARLMAVRKEVGASMPTRPGAPSRPSSCSTRCRTRAWTSSSWSSLSRPTTLRGCSTLPSAPMSPFWPMRACSLRRTP